MWSSMYAAMGLDPEWKFPLDNIYYCGIPKSVGSRLLEEPDIKSRSDAGKKFTRLRWDFIDVIRYRLLELALDQEEMSMSQNMQLLLSVCRRKWRNFWNVLSLMWMQL